MVLGKHIKIYGKMVPNKRILTKRNTMITPKGKMYVCVCVCLCMCVCVCVWRGGSIKMTQQKKTNRKLKTNVH
jgi:hypothetical protein